MSQEAVEIGDIVLIPDGERLIVSISTQEPFSTWSVAGAQRAIQILQPWIEEQQAKTAPGKPTKTRHVSAYDYHACRDYLERRDGYAERDYAGRFTGNSTAPYQDFWHFVLEYVPDMGNGHFFTMEEDWLLDAEPWQQEILLKYLDTFGEVGEDGKRFVELYAWW